MLAARGPRWHCERITIEEHVSCGSCSRAKRLTGCPGSRPVVFGAAVQVFGIEKVAPVHHVLSIVAESGMSFDGHEEVDPDAAAAVLPATLLGHVLPVALMGLLPMTATEVSRSSFGLQSIACHLFYVSPIAVSFLTILGAKAIRFVRERRGSGLSTGEEEAVAAEASEQPDAEVPALKTAYAVAFGLQAIKHLSTVPWVLQCYENITSRLSRSAAVSAVRASKTLERGLSDAMATEPLPYYKLATGIVGLYEVWDLRRRGYVTTRESIQAAVIFGGALHFCGVGAGYAGLWYWRENIRDRLRQRSEIARTA